MRPADLPAGLRHMPICPHRKLPIPYIAEVGEGGVGHFTVLDPGRQRECYRHRLCAMCGKQMGREVALIGDVVSLEPGGFYIEPPVHESCGELALGGLCPFLSGERVPRRDVPDDPTIVLLGDREGLAQVGRQGGPPKRPTAMGIYTAYRMAIHMGTAHPGGMPVFLGADPPVRTRVWHWGPDGRAVELYAPPGTQERVAAALCPAGPGGPQNGSQERRQPRKTSRAQRREPRRT